MRRHYLFPALAAACLVGGFVLGQSANSMEIGSAFPEVEWLKRGERQSPAMAPPDSAQDSSWEMLLQQVLATSDEAPDLDAMNKLQMAVNSDAAVRAGLIQRYDVETDEKARYLYIQLLGGGATANVIDFSSMLVDDTDASRRKDGLKLLADLLPDSKTFLVAKRALDKEKDPEVLRYAVAALHPRVVDPAETRSIVSRLSGLTRHADLQVRAQSLQTLAQWDKAGTTAEGNIYEALSDGQQEARQAAVTAVSHAYSRSGRLKARLIDIINDADASIDLRGGALRALEDFVLNVDEYKAYEQARAEVESLQTESQR